MIQLTRIHWQTGQIQDEILYVNPSHIIWMELHEREFGSLGRPTFKQKCTSLTLIGFGFHVLETPEQILEMLK